MKKIFKKALCFVLAAVLVLGLACTGLAKTSKPFADDAYATIVSASDFQHSGTEAYDRFDKVLNLAKNDGMPTPCSVLVGGDYTMVLLDNAVPGISRIRHSFLSAYPEADPESVVCIQGNHDNPKKEFAETGGYDMGAFNLFVINENDFPWNQRLRLDKKVKNLAGVIDGYLGGLIDAGDKRPVIFMTHVPLHHTDRGSYGDNMYSSYIFNVLNERAKKLDIIFLYGHNHSGDFDDYIGGSVNFLSKGDTIRIPFADKKGENCYTEEKLNFTYTNCGYIGYSDNTQSETSTNTLTMGVIQFSKNSIRFIKYSEDGVYCVNDVERLNKNTKTSTPDYPALDDGCLCHSEIPFVKAVWNAFLFFCRLFGTNQFCVCGEAHY